MPFSQPLGSLEVHVWRWSGLQTIEMVNWQSHSSFHSVDQCWM